MTSIYSPRIQNLIQKLFNKPYDEAFEYDFLTFEDMKTITDEDVIREFFKHPKDIDLNIVKKYQEQKIAYNNNREELNVLYIKLEETQNLHNKRIQHVKNKHYQKAITKFVNNYNGNNFSDDLDQFIEKYDYDVPEEFDDINEIQKKIRELQQTDFEIDYDLDYYSSKQTLEYYQKMLKELQTVKNIDYYLDYRNVAISYYYSNPSKMNNEMCVFPELDKLVKEINFHGAPNLYKNCINVVKITINQIYRMTDEIEEYLLNLGTYHPKLETIITLIELKNIPSSVKTVFWECENFVCESDIFQNVEHLTIKASSIHLINPLVNNLKHLSLEAKKSEIDLRDTKIETIVINGSEVITVSPVHCKKFMHFCAHVSNDYSNVNAFELNIFGYVPISISPSTKILEIHNSIIDCVFDVNILKHINEFRCFMNHSTFSDVVNVECVYNFCNRNLVCGDNVKVYKTELFVHGIPISIEEIEIKFLVYLLPVIERFTNLKIVKYEQFSDALNVNNFPHIQFIKN